MFEFYLYEKHRSPASPTVPVGDISPRDEVIEASLLYWGEHCVECAAPDCFYTCDIYQSRPDKRCRRFVYGIRKNPHFQGLRGPGAEVHFKHWGKIESRGNARLLGPGLLNVLETGISIASPMLRGLGVILGQARKDIRFHYLSYSLLERLIRRLNSGDASRRKPDAFLAEIYNPMTVAVTAQLTISVDRGAMRRSVMAKDLPTSYSKRLDIAPGYHRTIIPSAEFEHIVSSELPFNISFTPSSENAHLIFLALDLVRFREGRTQITGENGKASNHVPDLSTPDVKCVVFDLDNTLWDGVLLESDDVKLRPEAVDLIKYLDSRGILVSIASKNGHEQAWSKLVTLGLAEYFLYPRINWIPKSENIKAIASDLNIGLDTFAFIDDNPFERAEVQASLPMVHCMDVTEIPGVRNLPRYKGSTSQDARNRRSYYQQEMAREAHQAAFSLDYLGFLRSCEIVLIVRPFQESDFTRVAELVQRTNQLNFSGHKYSREEVRSLIDDPERCKYVIECADKFGSYGTVGFCIVSFPTHEVVIEDFMLSCRVQGKLIEQAVMSHLVSEHPSGPPQAVRVMFKRTPRNQPAEQVLQALHFIGADDAEGQVLDLREANLSCDFISLRAS